MSTATAALTLTIGLLPAFGITMVVIDQLAKKIPRLELWVVDRAAIIYLAFLIAGVLMTQVAGMLPLAVLIPSKLWEFLAALLLTPAAAILPYLLELGLVSARGQTVDPTLAAALFFHESEESVKALVNRPRIWWVVAVGTAVAEEVLFRGVVLHSMWQEYGIIPAILAGSIIFGLHHVAFGVEAIISKTGAGLLWALLTIFAGSLIPALLAHIIFQAFVWRRLRRVGHAGVI